MALADALDAFAGALKDCIDRLEPGNDGDAVCRTGDGWRVVKQQAHILAVDDQSRTIC